MFQMSQDNQKLWETLCKGVPPEVLEGWVNEDFPPDERDTDSWYSFRPWDTALSPDDPRYDPEELVGGFSFIYQTHCMHVEVLGDPTQEMVMRILRYHLENGGLDLEHLPESRWPRPVDGGSPPDAG